MITNQLILSSIDWAVGGLVGGGAFSQICLITLKQPPFWMVIIYGS